MWLTAQTGEICLDVLQSQWSPAWTLHSACTAVLALLDAPEPDSPLNVDAANLVRHDHVAYASLCRLYTERFAVRAAARPERRPQAAAGWRPRPAPGAVVHSQRRSTAQRASTNCV